MDGDVAGIADVEIAVGRGVNHNLWRSVREFDSYTSNPPRHSFPHTVHISFIVFCLLICDLLRGALTSARNADGGGVAAALHCAGQGIALRLCHSDTSRGCARGCRASSRRSWFFHPQDR